MRAESGSARAWGRWGRWAAFCAVLAVNGHALAEDSVAAVLERMKSTSAVRIAYRETRYLELFAKPVETSGLLYGMPPDVLIKEQKEPTRKVLGIFGDHYYYYDPDSGRRHSRTKDPEDPMNLHITAFQALANGDRSLLKELYSVAFYTEPGHWYMILTEKNAKNSQIRITVSGSEGMAAQRMEIHEADGERSVYQLEKDREGDDIARAVRKLEAELRGT